MPKRVALVSCVKSKRQCTSAAQDLYTSELFLRMRHYAEQHSDAWYILSAQHGVLAPDDLVAPYDVTLNRMVKREREQWGLMVGAQLIELIPPRTQIIVLAGLRYRADFVPRLEAEGYRIEVPMRGMRLGAQLRWLNQHTQPV